MSHPPASPAATRSEVIRHQVAEAAAAVRGRFAAQPAAGLILGTGLGVLTEQIDVEAAIDYRELPHFPRATALAHRGRLLCGKLDGEPIVAMDGRCHLYEGYSVETVTLPVRVMAALGAKLLLVSNAAGGLNPQLAAGDVVVVEDHINLMGRLGEARSLPPLPLGEERIATPAFRTLRSTPSPYDARLAELALAIARRENFAAQRGVYVAVTGPNYETRAEYRFFRRIGDVVGMSTAPEAAVAAECGMRVLALSAVTNIARPDAPDIVAAEDVAAEAAAAAPKVEAVFRAVTASNCRKSSA